MAARGRKVRLYDGVIVEIDGEYQVTQFRGSDACGGKQRIVSPTFPELNLTTEQIFQAGGLPT